MNLDGASSSELQKRIAVSSTQLQVKGGNPHAGHVTWLNQPDSIQEAQGDTPAVKVVTVGEGACGKTCFLVSYTTDRFPREYIPTVFDSYTVTTNYDHGPVMLGLFDTAGQDVYDRLRPLSYLQTDVLIASFSIASPISLINVSEKWAPEVKYHLPGAPILLVGLMEDLRADEGVVERLKEQRMTLVSYA